jgi:hypothetical protein
VASVQLPFFLLLRKELSNLKPVASTTATCACCFIEVQNKDTNYTVLYKVQLPTSLARRSHNHDAYDNNNVDARGHGHSPGKRQRQ